MADDLNQPFIGYRSAGRRRAALNDRAASADAPLALLRGVASGVLGAPGDIESLVRMLPGLSEKTVLPTSRDVEARLPLRGVSQTPIGRAATELGTLGGGFYTGPGSPLRAIAALPSAVSRAGRDFALAGSPVHVVKPKGGNWLAGSVERAIEPMKTRVIGQDPASRLRDLDAAYAQNVEAGVAMDPAVFARERARLEPEVAMNRWLESKLGKYIRNEMATPEDPLRALADRGVTHIPEGAESLERVTEWIPETLEPRRKAAGFPAGGMSQTPYGQGWEQLADEAIQNLPASERLRFMGDTPYRQQIEENPWIKKVPPETMTYGAYPVEVRRELDFEHLVDELKNAINPASGLPENLRWKYQDLDKVTVPQAVQRVSDINAWRAAQKAEADAARAMNPATHVFKEYPEQGFKWVELRQPKETGRKVSVEKQEMDLPPDFNQQMGREVAEDMAFDEGLEEGTREFNEFVQRTMTDFNRKKNVEMDESIKALEDALKYEGETMGHCVGGYCPDVVEGRSRIYSLRDKKGQPHVTIEVKPGVENPSISEGEFRGQKRFIVNNKGTGFPTIEEAQQYAREISTPEIVQIKGKANRAPKEEYLPAVQDFVRSGNWGRIGDLQNTGLVQLPDKRLLTTQEFDDALKQITGGDPSAPNRDWFLNVMRGDPSWWNETRGAFEGLGLKPGAKDEGFAAGGLVGGGLVGSNIYNSDAMQNPMSAYKFSDGGQAGDAPAYADGGLVANSPTGDFDPDRIDAIVGELNALNAG